MTRQEILSKAHDCVVGDRDKQYGSPEDSFSLIATLWNDYLNHGLDEEEKHFELNSKDVSIMMMLLKIARIKNGRSHIDNWIDIAGYAACGGEIEELLKKPK